MAAALGAAGSSAASPAAAAKCRLAGSWSQTTTDVGSTTWVITADGKAQEQGIGNASGTATLVGNVLTITWKTSNGYAGVYRWTLGANCSGTGTLTFTAVAPGDQRAGKSFPSTVQGPPPSTQTSGGSSGAVQATLGTISGDVSIRHAGGRFVNASDGEQLQAGDDISTGPDSSVTLTLPGGSTVTVTPMTQINIGSLLRQKNSIRVRVNLRISAIAAKLNKSKTADTDYSVKTPTATTSSRGTAFSVFYDPGSRATVVAVTQHSVVVTRTAGGKPLIVPAGKEAEVTAAGSSPLAPLGKANAHGGIDRAQAFALAAAAVGRSATACGIGTRPGSTAGFSVHPSATGWLVTIPVTGKVTGVSTWLTAGAKAKAANALAKQIAVGC